MRILVIEDDPTVGQYVKRGLEEQRWSVDLVADGEAGARDALSGATGLVDPGIHLPREPALGGLRVLPSNGHGAPGGVSNGVAMTLAELERRHIEAVLAHTNWHQGRAALALGISSKTLYRKIREYGFRRPQRV